MSNFKVHIDPKIPSKKETESYQNFDSIIKDASNIHRPWYVAKNILKDFKLVKILVLIMIVLTVLYFSHQNHENQEKEQQEQTVPSQNPLDR